MELILTEWMGVGEQVKLNDDIIFDLYLKHYCENKKDEVLATLKNKNKLDSKKNYKDLDEYNELLNKSDNLLLISNEIKGDFTNNLSEIFTEKFNEITLEINKLNTFHKNSIKDNDANPIIEFYKNNSDYYVKTYQYVTEFEIDLSNKNKKNEKNVLKIKIQARNLVSREKFKIMLKDIFNVKTLDNISGTESNDFLVLFYIAYLSKLKEVLKRGVHRTYVDYEENLPYLKERLLVHEHIRHNYIDKSKFYCAYSEISPDNLINKAIVKSILHIKKYRAKQLSKHIHQISQAVDLSEITDLNFNLKDLNNIKFNRQNARFKEIIDYCKVILRNSGASFSSSSDLKYSSYYLDMNDLFESFFAKRLEKLFKEDQPKKEKEIDESIYDIINIIKENNTENNEVQNHYKVTSQIKMNLDDDNTFKIIPDVIVNKDNKEFAVLDTKYKRLTDSSKYNYNISREDIYQVITYAHRLKITKAFLVYPKPPNQDIDNKVFTIRETELHICFVDLLETNDTETEATE